jgi:selenocysteine lyase/cysteine desulfurase
MNYKKDFPIFGTHPSLVYMDSAATTQKPQEVIDAVSHYLQSSNSNIHRGAYKIAEESEEAYWMSKVLYSTYIGAKPHEIIYTYNATYAFNMIAQSLVFSKKLQT